MAFAQDPDVSLATVAGTNGRTYARITCHGCHQMGHYQSHCPNRNREANDDDNDDAVQMLLTEEFEDFVFLNAASLSMPDGVIPWHWILLDNQSTVHAFKDKCFLKNIRRHPEGKTVKVHCTAAVSYTHLTLPTIYSV